MSNQNTNSKELEDTKTATVFGANGKVGQLIVSELLKRKYHVRAFVYKKHTLVSNKRLKIIHGDVRNINNVNEALRGSNIVFSALGSWGTKNKDILSFGMKNIIPTMQKQNIKRIISVTGADALLLQETQTFLQKMSRSILRLLAQKILDDGEKHLELLSGSLLEWTVLRSPIMNSRKKETFVVDSRPCKPWETVSRKSVALAMVSQAYEKSFIGQAPFIHKT
ncbi:NAD(P)H-binding protein [Candidatus Saccharibacteria bacterium]|nr:NAD(P)H-binding protein [Candidatus Saccharibacteria bacterium]